MKILFLIVFIVLIGSQLSSAYLRVQNKELYYNNEKVFLSGSNIAWYSYAKDFGSGAYNQNQIRQRYEQAIDRISGDGGNVIRVWVHIDGQWSPKFKDGYATGEDTNSLISDLGQLLDYAAKKNVFVIVCLWNLAVKPDPMINLYYDEAKLLTYIEKVLKPLVAGLKNKPALAAYEPINEPSGSLEDGISTPGDPCYDTTNLKGTGVNWTKSFLKLWHVLRFINYHADAIKSVDPKALVTIGDSDYMTTSNCGHCREYYSDQCLSRAGGKQKGTLDFYQMHSYTWEGKYSDNSPLKKRNSDYKSSKPILVGEFATVCSESQDPVKNYKYIYESGYCGALSWQYSEQGDKCADKMWQADQGISAIKDMNSNGKIRIQL